MDSPRIERGSNRSLKQHIRSWWRPFLWVPLLVLVSGVMVTAFTAHLMAGHTRTLSEQAYSAQHDALVSRLHARAAENSPDAQVEAWLASVFPAAPPPLVSVRVDTLERHTKTPLFQRGTPGQLDGSVSLRTEINLPDHRWLITTVPDMKALKAQTDKARLASWLAGMLITTLGVALTLLLCARIYRLRTQLEGEVAIAGKLDQQLGNSQVEKAILRQALNDSEQRSRDLVALSGSIIGELDEQGCIGFISAEVAEFLDRAPADLAGSRFEELTSPQHRTNLKRTLDAARSEKTLQRIDLDLLSAAPEVEPIPVTLRVLALRDPLHGFVGYRISARPATPVQT